MSFTPNAAKPPETWSGNMQCPECLFFVSAYAPTEIDLDMSLIAAMSTHTLRCHPGKTVEAKGYEINMKNPPKLPV